MLVLIVLLYLPYIYVYVYVYVYVYLYVYVYVYVYVYLYVCLCLCLGFFHFPLNCFFPRIFSAMKPFKALFRVAPFIVIDLINSLQTVTLLPNVKVRYITSYSLVYTDVKTSTKE